MGTEGPSRVPFELGGGVSSIAGTVVHEVRRCQIYEDEKEKHGHTPCVVSVRGHHAPENAGQSSALLVSRE